MKMIDVFMERLSQNAPIYFKSVDANRKLHPDLFDQVGERLLTIANIHLGADAYDILINGYCFFVEEVNRSQLEYEKVGHYENHSYADVYAKTYNNSTFMNKYHWGVFTIAFAWEHHLLIYDFFCSSFIPLIKDKNVNEFKGIDLGCGSGLWHLSAIELIPSISFDAVDISQTSVDTCNKTRDALKFRERTQYYCADATTFNKFPALYDTGISCFLLEHLERPDQLLFSLARNLKEGAYAFVTCALTAGEVDHIYEFKHEYEAAQMAHDAGFRVCQLVSIAPKKIAVKSRFLPRSVAMILQKRRNDIW
jgi:ubiquinone/menaquinone biosynthesis C-methylase UbiE